jgi:drug/metabolite transporter (DMT)-like permease
MGAWKLFALVNVLLASFSLRDLGSYDPGQTINFAIEVLSTIGIVLMSFELTFLPRKVWRALACIVFAKCFSMIVAWGLVEQSPLDRHVLEALLAFALFHFAVGYGLWLYGSRQEQHADVPQLVRHSSVRE